MAKVTPLPLGTKVNYHGTHGVIDQAVKDRTDPTHYRYLIRWSTGTSGWWGHNKVVADMTDHIGSTATPYVPPSQGQR